MPTTPAAEEDGPTTIPELELLRGVEFRCRPECGLCCFAAPATTPEERSALLEVEPHASFEPGPGGLALLRARPGGGACQLLQDRRCRGHPARPFPCRSFPLHVHVGARVQASVVLSCPGVDLGFLGTFGKEPTDERPPVGLDGELASVRLELGRRPVGQWLRTARGQLGRAARRFERAGFGFDLAGASSSLSSQPPWPEPADFPVPEPPGVGSAPEELPIFQDDGQGTVGLRAVSGGWEVVGFREAGGTLRSLGVFRPPEVAPRVTDGGRRELEGYLRYVAARDFTWWSLLANLEGPPEAAVVDLGADRLRGVAATVLSRAWVREVARGRPPEPLDDAAVQLGIRATDSELLDQPTFGRIL